MCHIGNIHLFQLDINYINSLGYTPVWIAYKLKRAEIFEFLIKQKADCSYKPNHELPLLIYLLKEKKVDNIKLIIDNGFDINEDSNTYTKSWFHIFIMFRVSSDLLEYIVTKGANFPYGCMPD